MARNTSLILFFILFFSLTHAHSQKRILEENVKLPLSTATVIDHLTTLENLTSANFTYSSSYIDVEKVVTVSRLNQSLKEHLTEILKGQNIKFTSSGNRILLSRGRKKYQLIGVVYDGYLKEGLLGVRVYNKTDNHSVVTDEEGYFTISSKQATVELEISYFGYDDLIKEVTIKKGITPFYLSSGQVIPEILITDQSIGNTTLGTPNGHIIQPVNIGSFSNFLGDNSISEEIKNLPFVQSGNEGESGFHVRGGGVDQNLFLYEGVPLYESNHTAGLSSILIADAVKDISVFAESLPARYGGRLSSVIDVRLKSGKSDSIVGSSSLGLTGANFYLSGPLSKNKKLLFNISGRVSLIHLYIEPILRNAFSYENSDLDYNDFNAKLTYQFGPSHTLSVFAYSGKDQLLLNRRTVSTDKENTRSFANEDRNQIGWGNKLLALNYTNLLSDKLVMKTHFSTLNYDFTSRGSYRFIESKMDSIVKNREVDIISFSSIRDYNSFADLSYYHSDNINYKVGVGRSLHNYSPTIRQSSTIAEDVPGQFEDGDSTILVKDQFIYGEATFIPFESLHINTGVRLSDYEVRGKNYSYTEPRLEIGYTPFKGHHIGISYAQMVQYVHLLVSPSAGIPSDLWVPSTDKIEPEFGQQFSISYSVFVKDNFKIKVGAYRKTMDNLLEYSNPTDLFYSVLNEEEFVPVFTTSNEWERRVTTGSGKSHGIELGVEKAFANVKLNFSYAYNKTTRSFAIIDDGEEFPYKYDRTHDINTSVLYNLGTHWNFAAKWVYGTGNTFTLATEQFLTAENVIFLRPSKRNNFRHLPFHHLDVNANYIFVFKDIACRLNMGVYNVYNRLNPNYIYLYEDPLQSSKIRTRQVSLFPVIPHIGLKLSW